MRDIKRIMEEYSDEYNLNGKPIKQGFKKKPKANDAKSGKKKGGHRQPNPNKTEWE